MSLSIKAKHVIYLKHETYILDKQNKYKYKWPPNLKILDTFRTNLVHLNILLGSLFNNYTIKVSQIGTETDNQQIPLAIHHLLMIAIRVIHNHIILFKFSLKILKIDTFFKYVIIQN